MEKEITNKTIVTNVAWNFAEKVGIQVVSSIVSIVIARFVEPSAYGVITLANAVIAILNVFVDSGLANALIQKKDPDDLDYSTVFFTNMTICSICYLLVFFAAPAIGRFYNSPSIVALIRVLAISLIVSGLKDVQHAYIAKNMIYKKFFFASIAGTIGSGIIGIIMAIAGFGVWALAASTLFDLILDTLVIWLTIKWRPKLIFSFNRLKNLFSYGSKLLVNSLLGVAYNKLYQFVIGKHYSTQDLAFYDKGEALPTKLVGNLTSSLNGVMKPVLSNSQDNNERMKEIASKTIKVSSFVMLPMLVGLAVISEPLVKFLLTDKWLSIVPYIRIMCVVSFESNLININANVLRAKGKSDLVLKYCTITEIVGILLLLFTVRINVFAMAISMIVNNTVELFMFAKGTKHLINYSLMEQIRDIYKIVIITFVMGILVYYISFVKVNTFVLLIMQILAGTTIYISFSYIFKIDSFYTLLRNGKKILNKLHE